MRNSIIISKIMTWYHTIDSIKLYIPIFKIKNSFKTGKIFDISKMDKNIIKIKLIIQAYN